MDRDGGDMGGNGPEAPMMRTFICTRRMKGTEVLIRYGVIDGFWRDEESLN